MAREEKKRVELRTVDEEVAPVVEVVRLRSPETGHSPEDETPIRLGPSQAGEPPSRLDLPSREEIELRTHQPGVDALIETELIGPEFTEDSWGAGSTRRHPIPWGWFALIGLAIASALVWSLASSQPEMDSSCQPPPCLRTFAGCGADLQANRRACAKGLLP